MGNLTRLLGWACYWTLGGVALAFGWAGYHLGRMAGKFSEYESL